MDEAQKAAYIMSQCVCAMAEIYGMMSENMRRQSNGLSIAYGEEAFAEISNKYVIGHNSVIGFFSGR